MQGTEFTSASALRQSWGMLDGVAVVVVDRVELLLEIGDVAREPSGERIVDGLTAPVGLSGILCAGP